MPSDTTDYNPYIHGTTSTALAALVATDQQLMPVLAMLAQGRIPLTGEIVKGGFVDVGGEFLHETYSGATSFGRVWPENKGGVKGFSLEDVMKRYTQFNALNPESCKEAFTEQLNRLFQRQFNNINLFLIQYARARKLNPEQGPLITQKQHEKLNTEYELVLKYYQLVEILLGGYVIPNREKIKPYIEKNPNALEQWFGIEPLMQQLVQITAQELSSILQKPSTEQIKNLLQRLTQGNEGLFDIRLKKFPQESTEYGAENDSLRLFHFFYYMNEAPSASIEAMIFGCQEHHIASAPFTAFRNHCRKHRAILQERYALFEGILNKEYSAEPKLRDFNSNFPVVFVTESSHLKESEGEYRSRVPLKLGVNIHLIATQTETDRQAVENHLLQYNIKNVQTILIETLKNPDFRPNIRETAPEIVALEKSQMETVVISRFAKEYYESLTALSSESTEELNPVPTSIPTPTPSSSPNYNMMILSGFITVVGIAAVALAFTVLNAATLGIAGVLVAALGVLACTAGVISLGLFAYRNQRISTPPEEPELGALPKA